ncbi:eukaryotic translation initiation factor 4B isoform X3 [Amblyraja radiata]|uniref:eukaryotic translation initiation factor 4B isoform X3 n=1 Tax=Amblyraja radiata TaxID=386614 RepID=UPI001401F092|nr:eukaryotic translation initiation factor 4B isoform X3 [Amblyraja radiata]
MASSGKKKQKKGKTLTLTDFLAEDGGGNTPVYIPSKPVSWADETDDMDNEVSTAWPGIDDDAYKSSINRALLPTAPRAARAPDIDMGRIPKQPPYTAFLGNLPYEVSEESIRKFFHGMNISAVRLPRESTNQDRLKGFGYAEFDDVESLMNALSLNEEMLQNRRVRVDIADQAQEKEREAGRGGDRDRVRDAEMETDWRARPTTNTSSDDFPTRRMEDSFGDRTKDRYESRDRDGPRRDGDRFRDDSFRDRGFGSSVDRGSRRAFGTGFRRDNYDDKRSDDYRGGGDRYSDRNNDGFDRFERRDDRRSDFGTRDETRPEVGGSVQRPKLNLKPRSITKEEVVRAPPAVSSGRSASIFGAAKPVDTTAKEREVEERLKKEQEKYQRQIDDQERGIKGVKQPRESDYPLVQCRHPSWRSEDQVERTRPPSDSSQPTETSAPAARATVRRESEKSLDNEVFSKEEEPQSPVSKSAKPDQLRLKVVPAPPPKENAWTKRTAGGSSSTQNTESEATLPLSPTSASSNKSIRSPSGKAAPVPPPDDKAENEILEKTSPKERGGANSAVSRGQNDGINKDRRKEPDRKDKKGRDSKPITEPKKYEELPTPKFSSASKYAALMIDAEEEEEDSTE